MSERHGPLHRCTDPRSIDAAEAELGWTWTESGFRVDLLQERPGFGVPWAGILGVLLLIGAPLGLLEWVHRGLVGPLLLAVAGGMVTVTLMTLVFAAVAALRAYLEGEPIELPVLTTPQPSEPVTLEVRGSELLVDGEAWPLMALDEVAFRGGRLHLRTAGRRWHSREVPSEVGREAREYLVGWLRRAHGRAKRGVGESLAVKARARAATRAVVLSSPSRE